MCFGLEPGVAVWKAQMNTLNYGLNFEAAGFPFFDVLNSIFRKNVSAHFEEIEMKTKHI